MKSKERVLTVLNKILLEELNAANKNISLYKDDETLDFGKVYETVNPEIEREASEKLKQAEWLIKRIIFLEVWRTRQSTKNDIRKNPDINFETRSKAV